MKKPTNVTEYATLLLMLAIALFATVMVFDIAYGDDDHKHHDDDGDTVVENVLTGGDHTATNSISGGRSFGLGLGDVDINDCLYSWSFIVQGVRLNKWCASERMDVMGLHDSAAIMRCTIRSVKKLYKNKDQCIKAQTMTEVLHVEPPAVEVKDDDEDDDRYEALYARISAMEAERVQDKAESKKAVETANMTAQRANAIAVRAEQRSVSQYGITEEQRQELAEVFKQ